MQKHLIVFREGGGSAKQWPRKTIELASIFPYMDKERAAASARAMANEKPGYSVWIAVVTHHCIQYQTNLVSLADPPHPISEIKEIL